MNLRLEAFGDLAPFWYFIENGVPQELSSDKGGFPTPASSPAMRTVEKSRQEFTVEFENFWDREIGLREERTVESIDEIEYTLSKLYDLLDKAQKALALLIGGGGGPTEYEIVENLLKKQLDKSKYGKKADPEKAAQLIRQLIEGEEIPDRIRLGGGARPRTIELQRQVDEALSRD